SQGGTDAVLLARAFNAIMTFRYCIAAATWLAVTCLAPVTSEALGQKDGSPWIATVAIIRNGEEPGAGVYLQPGLIITAAHLTAVDADMRVRILGLVLAVQ